MGNDEIWEFKFWNPQYSEPNSFFMLHCLVTVFSMSSTDQSNAESDQEHILLKQGDSGISTHFSTSLYAASWCQFTCISNDETSMLFMCKATNS